MILLFGGSFDPVHVGHVGIARVAQGMLEPQKLLWLPTPRSPLKDAAGAGAVHRAAMLDAMLAGACEPAWAVDRSELDQPVPAYTIDTLRRWRAELGPDTPLAFLVGLDSLHALPAWRDWQALTEVAHLVVAHRPDQPVEMPEQVRSWLKNRQTSSSVLLQSRPFGSVMLLDTPPCPVSSTALRAALADERLPQEWLPAGVGDYIVRHGLYRATENPASP